MRAGLPKSPSRVREILPWLPSKAGIKYPLEVPSAGSVLARYAETGVVGDDLSWTLELIALSRSFRGILPALSERQDE